MPNRFPVLRAARRAARCAAFACAGVALAQESAPPAGVLTFVNGDRVTVALEGWDAEEPALRVRHPNLRAPVSFARAALRRFTVRGTPGAVAPRDWSVWLENGDRVGGGDLTLDEQGVRLRHPVLGPLRIPAAAVGEFSARAGGNLLYEGPFPGDEWLIPLGTHTVEKDALRLATGAAYSKRIAELPRRLQLDFRLSGMPQGANVGVLLFGQRVAEPRNMNAGSGYTVQLTGFGRVSLIRRSSATNASALGHQQVQWQPAAEDEGPGLALTLYADLEDGRFFLFRGAGKMAEWNDPPKDFSPGPIIAFLQMGNMETVFRDIRVARWDGRLPTPEDSGNRPAEDLVRLVNDDTLSGELKGIGPQGVALKTRYGDVMIPVERVRHIRRRGSDAPPATGTARVRLRDGDRVTVDLLRFEKGALTAMDSRLGTLRIPLPEIREIEWLDAGTP